MRCLRLAFPLLVSRRLVCPEMMVSLFCIFSALSNWGRRRRRLLWQRSEAKHLEWVWVWVWEWVWVWIWLWFWIRSDWDGRLGRSRQLEFEKEMGAKRTQLRERGILKSIGTHISGCSVVLLVCSLSCLLCPILSPCNGFSSYFTARRYFLLYLFPHLFDSFLFLRQTTLAFKLPYCLLHSASFASSFPFLFASFLNA